jgi:putative ABC transport system permease protein
MIKNYFKVAFRSLLKRKGYSFINILGLAVGMASCLLIVLFVQSELNYDLYQQKGDHIVRVALERKYPGRSTSYSIIPQSIGPAIQKEFPEVEACTRIFNFGGAGNGNFFMRVGEKVFEEKNVLAVDSNFFSVFTGSFLYGNPAIALQHPNSVVVSESTATKMFGSAEAALGKEFLTDAAEDNHFMITGVVKDWPDNSHFTFNVLLSDNSFPFIRDDNYINFAAHTYLLLRPGANAKALEAKFPIIIDRYVSGEIARNFGQSFKDFEASGNGYRYYIQPLRRIHLSSDLEAELGVNGSMTSVYIFTVIAIFILFLACINFINLSTARSAERAKEVGIRKTFGSGKSALMGQFIAESILISFLSLLIAFGLIWMLLPLFNKLADKDLGIAYFFTPLRLLFLLCFSILVGVIAGLYPAFVLSSFKPITVLKGRFKSNKYGLALRNGLVVFQFAISVILIISAIIVSQQMNYMLSGALGFKKDHIITVERTDLLDRQHEAFKTELQKIQGVESVSGASSMPGAEGFFGVTFQPLHTTESLTGRGVIVDEDFAKTLHLHLKEGRFFSPAFSTDSLSLVLNETAVKELGLKDPIGTKLTTPDNNFNAPGGSVYEYTVVGVLKDFHFQSLHQKITPLVMINSAKFHYQDPVMAVRIDGNKFNQVINRLEGLWKKFISTKPFHFSFLDQTLANQYRREQTTQKIFTTFSGLAIFIACFGLLGLVAYTTQQRNREISIRKVLGASPGNIITILSKDFLKLVAIGSVVGFPIAWWAMYHWLQNFAFRIDMDWWIFLLAGTLAVFIALLTVSFQSVRAALSNPIRNLRAE